MQVENITKHRTLLENVRVPHPNDKLYKEECVFSFDNPDSPDGVFVCLNTFLGFSKKFAQLYCEETNNRVYLNLRRITRKIARSPSSTGEGNDENQTKVTRLALNVEGGFNTNDAKVEHEEVNQIAILPELDYISLDDPSLPNQLIISVSTILSSVSAARQEEILAMQGTWEGEQLTISKHSNNLVQVSNDKNISPTGPWKCEQCDKTDNLWLNLSDGSILCGRRNFDGSGGNDHAIENYKINKPGPLAVKLGTITPNGSGDVYSYDEDSMVIDANLVAHLGHWGLNAAEMTKTEKSLVEMEIDLNQKYDEWSIIQEDGSELRPIFGPGYTGLANLGNSCYLNSIVQVVFSIDEFVEAYYRKDKRTQYLESSRHDPAGHFRTQLMKLAAGLCSGEYSLNGANMKEQIGIKPIMFKNLVGRHRPQFMNKQQQDAQEFLISFIDLIERMHRDTSNEQASVPTDCFKFQVETRLECSVSHTVKYDNRAEYFLSLSVADAPKVNHEQYEEYLSLKEALEKDGRKAEDLEVVRPIYRMTDLIEMSSQYNVENYYSPAIKNKTLVHMQTRFKTFPDFLIVHLKKFTVGADLSPVKLDVSLQVPDVLDLELWRGKGMQKDEVLMPQDEDEDQARASQPAAFNFDQNNLSTLTDMGFSVDAAKRALYNTQTSGSIEQATNWLFAHFEDANLNEPFVVPTENVFSGGTNSSSAGGASAGVAGANVPGVNISAFTDNPNFVIDDGALQSLLAMGMNEEHSRLALHVTNNNSAAAIEWIFNNQEQIPLIQQEIERSQHAASVVASSSQDTNYRDGCGRYELSAFVSHMGTSSVCGHYVCHIKKAIDKDDGTKESKWVIFNDNKVAESAQPPKQFAYLYFYKRIK